MQHIGPVLSNTMSSIVRAPNDAEPDTDPQASDPPDRTLHDLMVDFLEAEALENPDVVLPLKRLRMTDAGTMAVPDLGSFEFTDWSRRQIASLLGIKWDKWFSRADQNERADEINRRLWRSEATVRLRTSRHAAGVNGTSGVLRAFVSSGYSPIADSRVARLLAATLAPVDPELRIIRFHSTDMTVTYVVGIGRPFRPGDSHEVGDVWGGLLVRNSGVGFASLVISAYLTRLLCKNGMTSPLPDALVLRRVHRGVDDETLRELLAERVAALPGRLRDGADLLRRGLDSEIADVPAAVHAFLRANHLPIRHTLAILEAFEEERSPTAFGVAQAVTRAAQALSPEERHELERAAGSYLASA